MEERLTGHETEGSLPDQPQAQSAAAATPIAEDDSDVMEVDSNNEDDNDVAQDIERFRHERANVARTLYHQHRGDDDTM